MIECKCGFTCGTPAAWLRHVQRFEDDPQSHTRVNGAATCGQASRLAALFIIGLLCGAFSFLLLRALHVDPGLLIKQATPSGGGEQRDEALGCSRRPDLAASRGMPQTPRDVFARGMRQPNIQDDLAAALNQTAALHQQCFSQTPDSDRLWDSYVLVQADTRMTLKNIPASAWADKELVRPPFREHL